MQPPTDTELLREYADHSSEEAFAALVARHVNKVYSVALRHVGNPHQAEEITQVVFVILARKARSLGKGVVLSGWLYHTARLAALTFLKSEIRRARREQEAHMQSITDQTETGAWTQMAPLLDHAMAELGARDRDAIVLRYFDGKSMREVGAALATSEDAAKKRINRAVEKLRLFFARRGIILPATVLITAISANSVQAAPAHLAASAVTLATAKGAALSTSTLTLIKGALKIMAWTKAKTAAVAVAAVILATGTTTIAVKTLHSGSEKFTEENLDAKIARLSHPGATVQEVIQVLGEPAKYTWEGKTFDKKHLPENYILLYSHNVSVWGSRGEVAELRSEGPAGGFTWHGKLRLGSSLDEALETLGPPSKTVTGKLLDFMDGVLYRDIDGRKGYGYYSRLDQGIRVFFRDNKVGAIYVILGGGQFGNGTPGEPIPDLDAKIARLSKPGLTVEEALQVLGEPAQYVADGKTVQTGSLPQFYLAFYPGGVSMMVNHGRVEELRSDMPGPGFTYRNRLHLGSSLDEVLEALGPPTETVVGKPLAFVSGVLYRNIDGRTGYDYYGRLDQNVRLFFTQNKVTALYVVLGGGELDSFVPGELIPDIDAKIVQLGREGATVEDAIRILGEPAKYFDGDETFQKNELPERYLAQYPGGVYVVVIRDRVAGLRSMHPGPGFSYHTLHLGSSLDEALSVLGQPSKTVVGAHNPLANAEGVLYKDIEGKKGRCSYIRLDQGLRVRLYFYNNKATALEIEIPGNYPAARP